MRCISETFNKLRNIYVRNCPHLQVSHKIASNASQRCSRYTVYVRLHTI